MEEGGGGFIRNLKLRENEGFILTNHLSDTSLTNQKQFSCLVPNMILPLSVALLFYQPNVIS